MTDLPTTLTAHRVVVATFSSPWCAPCRALEKALAIELTDVSDVGSVHVDIASDPSIAQEHRVTATPTMIGFVDGQPVARTVGYAGPAALKRFLRGLYETAATAA